MQKEIKTYGIKIDLDSLKKTSSGLLWCSGGCYQEIFYDSCSGEVWSVMHPTRDEWTRYKDNNVHLIRRTRKPCTPQYIMDAIKRELDEEAVWNGN